MQKRETVQETKIPSLLGTGEEGTNERRSGWEEKGNEVAQVSRRQARLQEVRGGAPSSRRAAR